MPTTRTRRSKRSQALRKNIPKRSKQQRKVPAGRIPGRDGGAVLSTSPGGIVNSYFLNPPVKDISPLDIYAENLFPPIENDWEDELKPLGPMAEWVPVLFKILKRVPGFVDDRIWDKIPDIHKLAKYLLKKARSAKPKNYFMFFGKNRRDNYMLAYAEEQGKYCSVHTQCIEWLPMYERISPDLAELAIQMIALVAGAWHLDLIDVEEHEMIIHDTNSFMSGEAEYDEALKRNCDLYLNGEVRKFKERLRNYQKTNVGKWAQVVLDSKASNELDIKVQCWLEAGIEVLNNAAPIGEYMPPFYIFDGSCDVRPLNANNIFGIHWSFRDHVYNICEDMMNATEREGGVIGPVVAFEYTEKHTNNKYGVKQIELLANWANLGRDIYFKYYDPRFKAIYAGLEDRKLLINMLT